MATHNVYKKDIPPHIHTHPHAFSQENRTDSSSTILHSSLTPFKVILVFKSKAQVNNLDALKLKHLVASL